MAQQIVAVDISPTRLRAVRLETSLRSTLLAAVHEIPVGEGGMAEACQTLRSMLPPNVDTVVVSADERTLSTRTLRFPFSDIRKVEAAIDFELENQVPYDLDDTVRTWLVTDKGPDYAEVLCALSPKAGFAERLAQFTTVGSEPRAVVFAAATLGELGPRNDTPVAVLSLGESLSHISISRGGIRFARTLRAGGADIDRVWMRNFGVDEATARAAKEQSARIIMGTAHDTDKKISDTVTLGLQALTTGIATTLKSLGQKLTPERLLLTGGMSRLPGLPEYLAERLGMPVELVDLQAAAPELVVQVPKVNPEYALALGMALGVLRHGRQLALNFRRGAFAYQGDLQVYRGHATRIAIGVAAVLALAIGGSIVRYSMISAEERRLHDGFCSATKAIVGREICDATAALATLRAAPGSGDGIVIPPYSAAALLEMMSKTLGKDVDVTFDELEIRLDGRVGEADKITAKGEAASFETTEQIAATLKRDPCVQEAEVSKQRKARDGGRVEFNLSVKVACPSGTMPGSSPVAQNTPPTEALPIPAAPGELP